MAHIFHSIAKHINSNPKPIPVVSAPAIDYSELLHFLQQPESYPHQPDSVDHIQTHISHVFIAPPYVYKVKKPLDVGFLDYSNLDQRKYYCDREVELNRRLCAEIYLSVLPISYTNGTFVFDPEKRGTVVEYAVHMKKLDEKHLLSERIKTGALPAELLDRVADKLAGFYQSQQPGSDILEWGRTDRIKANTDENFQQTEPFLGRTIERPVYEAIRRYTDGFLEQRAPLFQKRIDERRIVDGHGDLHLEHIHVTPERVCIYDCIEFNERFRYQDQASDLAYLAMDLDFNGQWEAARYFIDRMTGLLDDPGLQEIVTFYKCYRAYVKGKVKSLQSDEEEVGMQERNRARETAAAYFNLSLRYSALGSRPAVLIFMGQPASGKSTLAQRVSDRLELDLHSSDLIRKDLAGLPARERTPESGREQLYSAEMSAKTYNKLLEHAHTSIREGRSVAVDATFSSRANRRRIASELESQNITFCFIETRAPADLIKKRLEGRRHQQGVVSDARLEDYEKLRRRYEPPEETEARYLVQVNTDQSIEQSLEQLYVRLADINLGRKQKH